MKTGTLTIMMALLVQFTFAQMNLPEMNFFKTDELVELVKRPLLIVEYTEDKIRSKYIEERLQQAKDEKKDELNEYNKFLLASDEAIKTNFLQIVKDNWKHNDLGQIRVITHDEAKAFQKNKETKYCIIMVRSFAEGFRYMGVPKNSQYGTGTVRGLIIQGSEEYGTNADYIGFPLIISSETGHSKADLEITLRILNTHIEQALKATKRFSTSDFVEQQISQNCEMKKDLKLQMNDDFLKDITPDEASALWPGKVNIEPSSSFLSTYDSTSDDAFTLFIETGHMSSSGISALTTMKAKTTIYGRIVVQPSTGKILGFSKSKMGKKVGEQNYDSKHFEEIASCK